MGVCKVTGRTYSSVTGEDMVMNFPSVHGATVIMVDPDTTISIPTAILVSVMSMDMGFLVYAGY